MTSDGAARMPALDGLRGVAILLVVAAHTNVMPQGYLGPTGVTLFFVLSGFLITLSLRHQQAEGGRIGLSRFYAARSVRLFPALLLMEVLVCAAWLCSGRNYGDYLTWARATTFYISNFTFQTGAPNVFTHTWSLAVEEQFYLLWPLILIAIVRWRRSWTVTLILLLASLSVALRLTLVGHPAVAYSSLPTNGFALLLGALLAIVGVHWASGPQARTALLLVCSTMIGLIVLYYGETWPKNVTGTVLVVIPATGLVAASANGSRVLASTPLRYVGRVSYAWYLWHWPLLYLTDSYDDPARAVRVALLAFLAAIASTHLVEEPLRRWWRHRNRQNSPGARPTGDRPSGSYLRLAAMTYGRK